MGFLPKKKSFEGNKRAKALILYIESGYGFKAPGVAIGHELDRLGVEVVLSDAFADLKLRMDKFLKQTWRLMLAHPFLFEIVYFMTGSRRMRIDGWIPAYYEKHILEHLRREKPDFILSTHFITTYAYARVVKKNKLGIPVFAYDSDVVTAHPMWVSGDVVKYYVSTQEGAECLKSCGQGAGLICTTSFPIDRKFREKFPSVRSLRKTLGLKDMFTALFMFGGEGIGNAKDLVMLLENAKAPVQVVALCGKNAHLKAALDGMAGSLKHVTLVTQEFTLKIHQYMYCSDVVLGKSGLNTVFEAIYLRKPFVVTMAMANEKFAAKFIEENKIGYCPRNVGETAALLVRLSDAKVRELEFSAIKARAVALKIDFRTERIAMDILDSAGIKYK